MTWIEKLPKSFYTGENVVQIAQDLLGKYLVTNFNNEKTVGKIVETEAYRAPEDKACHAYQNRYTERTKVMFMEGGVCYVYLCYGIHHLFNVVTGKEGMAHAVLIRGLEPIENVERMLERRKMEQLKPQLTAGPGILSKALGIERTHTGMSLIKDNSSIWIENRKELIPKSEIIASPRVGVDYSEECALWDWRFRIKGSKWASKAK